MHARWGRSCCSTRRRAPGVSTVPRPYAWSSSLCAFCCSAVASLLGRTSGHRLLRGRLLGHLHSRLLIHLQRLLVSSPAHAPRACSARAPPAWSRHHAASFAFSGRLRAFSTVAVRRSPSAPPRRLTAAAAAARSCKAKRPCDDFVFGTCARGTCDVQYAYMHACMHACMRACGMRGGGPCMQTKAYARTIPRTA